MTPEERRKAREAEAAERLRLQAEVREEAEALGARLLAEEAARASEAVEGELGREPTLEELHRVATDVQRERLARPSPRCAECGLEVWEADVATTCPACGEHVHRSQLGRTGACKACQDAHPCDCGHPAHEHLVAPSGHRPCARCACETLRTWP